MHRIVKKSSELVIVFVLSGIVLFAAGLLSAWTGPTQSPPNGNVSAPINVGTTDQVKNANLGVNGLAVFGNSLLQAASYLNWGTTAGSGGYGIRDNSGALEFKNSGGTWETLQAIIFSLTGGVASWTTSGNDIYNANTGNVGIGTASPGAKLHVVGGSGADTEARIESPDASKAAFLRVRTTGGQGEFAYGGPSYGYWGGANSLNIINANGTGPITFNHFLNGGPIEHMRLDTSGNVAIGTAGMANYIGWPGSLNVNGQVKAARFYDDDSNFYIDSNTTSVMNNMYLNWFWDRDNSGYYVDPNNTTVLNNVLTYGSVDTRGPIYMRYESFNNGDWYVCQSGQMLRLGAYCSASDERLKTNLEPITDVLDKLDNYRTVTFDWIDKEKRGDGRQIGVLAQDFAQDYPELVSADPDTGYLSFDYQRLSAVLLAGLKELNAKVRGFSESFQSKEITTDKLCITASSGEKVCVTGDELAALLAQ